MRKRILCPWHRESTPSCQVYHDGLHCFACGARGPLSAAGLSPTEAAEKPEPEDIEASIEGIRKLPLRRIRGLDLHADERSYYLVWPDGSYYKRRFLDARGSKYVGPQGHTPPAIVLGPESSTCIVVEGELNALSLALAFPELRVFSPGSATNFSREKTRKNWCHVTTCSIMLVMADNDLAGARACIEFLGVAYGRVPEVRWKLVDKDANDVLTESGPNELRKQVLSLLE